MRKFLAFFKTSVFSALSYRGDIFLFVLVGISQPLVILSLWLGVIYSGGSVPLSSVDLIVYYLLVILVSYFSSTWASQFITSDIRLGKISPYLLKPVSYLFFQLGNNFGEKTIKGLYLLPLLVILAVVFKIPFSFPGIILTIIFIASLISAIFLAFFIDICIGVAGFWFESTEALDDIYGMGSSLLSGKFIPLSVIPILYVGFFSLLPFRYLLSFPIEIIQNRLNPVQIVAGLLIQNTWLIGFILLYKLLWSKGVRKYSAVGA